MRELEVLVSKHTVLATVSWVRNLQVLAEKRGTNERFINECKDRVDSLMESYTLLDAIHKENDFLKSKNRHIENEINKLNELIEIKDRLIKNLKEGL